MPQLLHSATNNGPRLAATSLRRPCGKLLGSCSVTKGGTSSVATAIHLAVCSCVLNKSLVCPDLSPGLSWHAMLFDRQLGKPTCLSIGPPVNNRELLTVAELQDTNVLCLGVGRHPHHALRPCFLQGLEHEAMDSRKRPVVGCGPGASLWKAETHGRQSTLKGTPGSALDAAWNAAYASAPGMSSIQSGGTP